ncbi:beta strand repeat-containing protein [Nanoarchaeota archaeon]
MLSLNDESISFLRIKKVFKEESSISVKKKMVENRNLIKVFGTFVILGILLCLYPVIADHVVTVFDGTTSTNFDEDSSSLYNITVNNTDVVVDSNITQVNITVPSGFTIQAETNETEGEESIFIIDGDTLSWTNLSVGLLSEINYNWSQFLFNATAPNPGYYNLSVVTSNSTTIVQTNISITIDDITAPTVSLVYPNLGTNTSNTAIDVNLTVTDGAGLGLQACWWTNDTGTTNNSVTCGDNITGQTWDAGVNTVIFYANDTSGNEGSGTSVFTLDTTAPTVTLVTPTLGANTTNTIIDVNFTVTENGAAGIGSCWWTNDTGTTNNSITCGDNVTGLTWDEGINTVILYANDTAGNEGSGTSVFTLDTTAPSVTLVTPALYSNTTNNQINVNFTLTDGAGIGLQSCWWSNDTGTTNNSITCGENITGQVWNAATQTVYLYANDSLGNENYSTAAVFTVDNIGPTLTRITPTEVGTNTTNNQLDINFSAVDSGVGLGSCWFTNNSGITNNSMASCTGNLTGQTWDEGVNSIQIYANDSLGNTGAGAVITTEFTLDTTAPVLTLVSPTLGANVTNAENVTFTVTDGAGLGLETCWWTNDTGTTNNTVTCGTNITAAVWDEGVNTVILYANDTLNNIGTTTSVFTVDSTPPAVVLVSPALATNTTNTVINVNFTASDVSTALQACWWTNSSGAVNNSITCGANITGQTWDEGSNTVVYYVNDTMGNENSSTAQFTIDTTGPTFVWVSQPATASVGDNVSMNVTVSDGVLPVTANITINNTVYVMTNDGSDTFNLTYQYISAVEYNVTAWDGLANSAISASTTLSTTSTTSNAPSGGASPPTWTELDLGDQTTEETQEVVDDVKELIDDKDEGLIKSAVLEEARVGEEIKFTLKKSTVSEGQEHTATINKISSSYIKMTIESDPITLLLFEGDSKKVDTDGNGKYDLLVVLKEIGKTTADVVFAEIREITMTTTEVEEAEVAEEVMEEKLEEIEKVEAEEVAKEKAAYNFMVLGIALAVIVLGGIIYAGYSFRKKKHKKHHKKK